MKIRLFGILFIVSIILGGCDIDAPPQTVIMPTASPVAGEVASGTKITLATTTEGATILYTTDGNDPLTNGTSYSSPIAITSPVTIKAIAIKSGMTNSAVLSAAYTITKVTHSLNGFTAEEITGGLSITKYSGNLKNLVIPGSIDGIPVISLDGSPFYGEDTYGSDIYLQLISVVIPESVTHIGDSVFRSIDLFGYSKTSGTYLSGGITIGANVTIENNYGGGQRPDGTVIGVGHTGNFSAYERDHIGGWLDLGFTKFYNENGKKAGTYTWNYSYNSNNYKYTFTWSFNPSSSSNPGQEGKETNGSLTQTHWYAFGYHAVIGSQGNGEMDSSNQISIGVNTTTLTGDFWGDYQGTYPSFYLDHNPNLTIPTPPRVYVQVNSDDLIELVQGSHADYGTIIFVSLFPDGDRIDVYFRSSDTISIPGGNNNGDNGILYPQWQVSSFAGNGIPGFADGTGTATQFFTPVGIAVDTNGNIYVADTSNNRIRRITSSGVVTSFAGTNTAGYANGTGTAARFSSPEGLTIDKGGNIYVADTGNHCIKKITPERVVSNFAGTNTAGYANGVGTAARFSSPKGLTIDKDGNIYVADTGNHCIKKITPEGVVSNFAGINTAGYANGIGTAARFSSPKGLAIDGYDNIYVADTGNHCIKKITPERIVSNFAGTNTADYANGTGTAARFSSPEGIAIDKYGNIFVADTGNHCIKKITSDRVVSNFAGINTAGYANGTGTAVRFSSPKGLVVDGDSNIYVADTNNNRIRKIQEI